MHSLVLQAVQRYVTETVSDAEFERALADVGPYASDVFDSYDRQEGQATPGAGT